MRIRDFLKEKGIKDENISVKLKEIEVLLSITAFDSSFNACRENLPKILERVANCSLTEKDIEFINGYQSKEVGLPFFENCKVKMNLKEKNISFSLPYFKTVWFYIFVAKNINLVDRFSLQKILDKIEKNEIENNIKIIHDGTTKSRFDSLYQNFVMTPSDEEFKKFANRINEKYIDRLSEIYQKLLTISKYNSLYKAISQIYKIDAKEFDDYKIIKFSEVKKTNYKIMNNSQRNNNKKMKDPSNNKNHKIVEDVHVEIEGNTSLDVSVDKNNNQIDNSPTIKKANPKTNSSIQFLKKHKEIEETESLLESFDDSLNRLIDLSNKLQDEYRDEGIQIFLKTINSQGYCNLLDQFYFLGLKKDPSRADALNIATLFVNALAEHGYIFEYYQDEPLGCIIGAPSEDDIDYIIRNYRYKGENVLYQNLFISAPGLFNRKTRKFVYPPLVEVKKEDEHN